jgi:ubiquinone/menaquinone biosynthesis C-methylase UbiE
MTDNHPTALVIRQNHDQYDSYYDKPDWWFRFRYDTQVKRKTCLHLVRAAGRRLSGQSVLEIGFGSGAVLFSFDRSSRLYGLELSQSAVEHAIQTARRKDYKNIDFRLAAENKIDFADDLFDLVIASHVIEHVEDDGELLREIYRTLKPGGAAVLLIPINENYTDPNHVHRYVPHDLLKKASSAGFKPAVITIENELLFHLVEKFYFEGYSQKKVVGPVLAALFNFPTAVLPFKVTGWIEQIFLRLGYRPRQFGCVLEKGS